MHSCTHSWTCRNWDSSLLTLFISLFSFVVFLPFHTFFSSQAKQAFCFATAASHAPPPAPTQGGGGGSMMGGIGSTIAQGK